MPRPSLRKETMIKTSRLSELREQREEIVTLCSLLYEAAQRLVALNDEEYSFLKTSAPEAQHEMIQERQKSQRIYYESKILSAVLATADRLRES